MTPEIDILCAKLGEACYLSDFIGHPGHTNLTALNRDLVDFVMGIDPVVGMVPFGIVSDGDAGKICNIRGTQIPRPHDLEEWWKDLEAWLVPCGYATDARVHNGFNDLEETLYVGTGKPLANYLLENHVEIIAGHSLGGPLAAITAGKASLDLAILIESPRPGDVGFKAWYNNRVQTTRSYANPRDIFPKIPLYVAAGLAVEDFVDVAPFIPLDPLSVTPIVPDDLWANHNLTNCRRMMEAAS